MRRLARRTLDAIFAFDQWLARKSDARLASRLAGSDALSFSEDYVSNFTSSWEEQLGDYRGKPGIRLLEIGCFEGRASLWFLRNILGHPTARITCIDAFARRGGEPRFDHNIALSGFAEKTTKIRGRSEEVLASLKDERFDVVYIDGSHRAANVLMDAVASWQLLEHGGTLIFDDYLWGAGKKEADRPQRAIDLFLETMGERAELRRRDYQVIVRKTASRARNP